MFHLDGTVNKQNCRIWGSQNPHDTVGQEEASPSLTVWCGICVGGILGPFFFEERGHPVSVTAARYRSLILRSVLPALRRMRMPRARVWYQHDGASSHTARAVPAVLQDKFPGRVISKWGDEPWPPRSPDLSLNDFFLWGHVKNLVYAAPVHSLRQLKRRIRLAVRGLPRALLRRAFSALPHRLRECLRQRGGHLETVQLHHNR